MHTSKHVILIRPPTSHASVRISTCDWCFLKDIEINVTDLFEASRWIARVFEQSQMKIWSSMQCEYVYPLRNFEEVFSRWKPFYRLSGLRTREFLLFSVLFALMLINITHFSHLFQTNQKQHIEHPETLTHYSGNKVLPDFGDCQAIGRRRPEWAQRDKIISSIQEFANIYDGRPFTENTGGMRFHHSFGLWYTLRTISPKPSFVIESGANRGHSTWVIRKALPNVPIITISKNTPQKKVENAVYFTGSTFIDFNKHNWMASGLDLRNAVVLFDDHQSAYRRVFQEGISFGFRRFIFDDNCEYQQCDALSMKWLCETKRKNEWRGYIVDDFGKTYLPQTWEEHIKQTEQLQKIKFYLEFPPVFGKHRKIEPLISDSLTFSRLVGNIARNDSEFRSYAYMCHLEIWKQREQRNGKLIEMISEVQEMYSNTPFN